MPRDSSRRRRPTNRWLPMTTSATVARSARREGGSGKFATLVATGILLSRIAGLIRQRFLSHYLGLSDAADAFNAAFRIPNFLQNLFGEGVLSASFIPVYARLLAEGDRREARRVASAIAALLGLVTAALMLVGVVATPWLIDAIAPGFEGAKRAPVPGAAPDGDTAARQTPPGARHGVCERAHRPAELWSGLRGPRRGADQCVRR